MFASFKKHLCVVFRGRTHRLTILNFVLGFSINLMKEVDLLDVTVAHSFIGHYIEIRLAYLVVFRLFVARKLLLLRLKLIFLFLFLLFYFFVLYRAFYCLLLHIFDLDRLLGRLRIHVEVILPPLLLCLDLLVNVLPGAVGTLHIIRHRAPRTPHTIISHIAIFFI